MSTQAHAIASNREAWNASADQHRNSAAWHALLNAVEHAGFSCLDPTLSAVLKQIDLAGKDVVQLGCNNGRESLSLFALGARNCCCTNSPSAVLEFRTN